jgi:nitrate/TMAO reductase-like tetraheme cytochrome c subunit
MTEPTDAGTSKPAPSKRGRWKRILIRSAVVGGLVLLLGSSLVGYAEHKTSQPQFCNSCHIMGPYYDTWTADLHGAKLDVACVECHYAPGEQNTLKAKFRGLSQVTSYFSGRYGATRPRAHVSNASCMTAQCHGDLKFMDKPLLLGTAKFVHSRHLKPQPEREKRNAERLAELEKLLKTKLGGPRYNDLNATASESGPADARYAKLVAMCGQWDARVERATLVEFSQLRHRAVRVGQLSELQCTNCHAYHATDQTTAHGKAGQHFQVSTSTCFTCHFNNESFNTGTSACMTCHTPPQQEITVHAEMLGKGGENADPQAPATELVKMNHAEILAKKVACVSCHADAIQKDATVTRRDCERCHDQPRFFKDWKEPFSVDLVQRYHANHVHQQRAKCLDCHSEIQHKLLRGSDEFLTSAMSDCTRCHPNHHKAQVDLLLGRGGTGVPKSTPNLMFGARTNCTGCHTQISDDRHHVAMKATTQACIACHGDRHADTFEKWKQALELGVTEAEEAEGAARKLLDEKKEAPAEARKQAAELLAGAQADLKLVKAGNGLHNISYAIELLDGVTSRCREAAALLESP